MSSGTSPESVSPRSPCHKIQNGRIEKAKTKKESKVPTYRIGGRTFACEACKKGHRVSKCTHASERPVSMTHDPGRPSGDQKRHCDCPKQCSCTKKNCKCDRNCSCTQKMYMLVYVPMKDGDTGERDKEGEWKIDQEVITDLQGKKLTDDEIKVRNKLKQLQQSAKSGALLPENSKPSPTILTDDSAPKSCCQHKKNIEEQKQPIPVPEEASNGQRRPQCNCGTGCTCAFCLDHPNNQTSHLLAQQQAAYFSNQAYGQPQMESSWAPLQVGGSCMGTNPRFAISNTPNPSHSQFQTLFPAAGPAGQGGYFISYPFTRFSPLTQSPFIQPMHSPMIAKPITGPPPTPYLSDASTPATLLQPSTSCCHASIETDFAAQEPPTADPFDFSNYDIGNAVASGWNDSDEFGFDHVLEEHLPSFQDQNWDLSTIDPMPDMGGSTVVNAGSIKPMPISPNRSNAVLDLLSTAPSVSSSVPPTPCSHQTCCQHGVVPALSWHHGLQTDTGLPFHGVPAPIMHSVYTHTPS
jgi:hypothetical protein